MRDWPLNCEKRERYEKRKSKGGVRQAFGLPGYEKGESYLR